MRELLERLGVPSRDVQRINHKALQYRRMISSSPEAQAVIPVSHNPSFPSVALPEGSHTLSEWADNGVDEQDFFDVAEYLFSRGEAISNSGDYYWSPWKHKNFNRRLIIPFTHNGNIVGYTGRLIDDSTPDNPKYFNRSPANYLFNNEVFDLDTKYVVVVEGPLDAKAVDGVSPLGAKLSTEQTQWLNTCGKQVIVLADRDKSGQRLIDHAITNNWMVSFPKLRDGHGMENWWDSEVKDAADASLKYGKLYTIRSVISSAVSNKTEISVKRKLLY
jgi:5S rRNA maturation endonuclease (ribonuclease M5)